MKMKHWFVAASLCIAPLLSHAGVIYEWRSMNKGLPHDFALTLEFDHGTVRSGFIDLQLTPATTEQVFSHSGLLSLKYSAANALIEFFPRSVPMLPDAGTLFMKLNFLPGRFLTGSIWAGTMDYSVEIKSQGHVFTVLHANSDEGMPGCPREPIQCSGATGLVRQVPEPAPLALLAVGLAAAVVARPRGTL